jgi:predicted TIM-barrel fold metal-dependent hydrolase
MREPIRTTSFDIVDAGTMFGVRPALDQDLGSQTLLGLLAGNGVAHALVYSLKAVQFDACHGNDETLALCQRHAELSPVAVVDPRQGPDAFQEVARCAGLGFVAYRLFPDRQGWAIGNQAFLHLLRAIAETGCPAIVHTPASGDATTLLNLIGEWESPIVLAAVTYSTLSEALVVLADAPNFYLEAHRVALPGQVELMVDQVGAGRLLFASWAPLHAQRPTIDMVLAAEIDPAAKAAILGANARRLFALPGKDGS